MELHESFANLDLDCGKQFTRTQQYEHGSNNTYRKECVVLSQKHKPQLLPTGEDGGRAFALVHWQIQGRLPFIFEDINMGSGASKDHTHVKSSVRSFSAVGATEHNLSRKDRRRGKGSGNQRKVTTEKEQDERSLPQLDENGRLSAIEIVNRTKNSVSSKRVVVGTKAYPVEIDYAYWTQRGYYPDDPFKNNQDDLVVCSPFAGEHMGAMFAVFDGHGKNGHDCSAYAKKHLPRLLEKYIRQARVKKYENKLLEEGKLKSTKLFDPSKWPHLSPDEYKACCQKAFLNCNKEMQESTTVSNVQLAPLNKRCRMVPSSNNFVQFLIG
jgi:hypothetical protein